MKIAIQARPADVEAIRELLSPWKVSFSTLDEADVLIVYGEKPLEHKKTIVVPSDSGNFMKWIKDAKLRILRKLGEQVSIAAGSQTVLTIMPQVLYYYNGLVKPAPRDNPPTATELGENLVVLTLDVVKENNKVLDETLNAKPSTVYGLLNRLPVPYTLVPKRLRNFFMSGHGGHESLTFCDKLPLDALRFILVKAIEKLSDEKLHKKMWNGKSYACVMTHDIDTRDGLERARVLKKLEARYDVPSAWYIPTKHYKLEPEIFRELANYGEIGAHGTRHDGKLTRLPKLEMVRRIREAKQTLEKIADCPVIGFRAPLLQSNGKLVQALEEADYVYDTSIPAWEPKHPYTLNPHGIGMVNLMKINKIIEIPVTLPQDHQMLYVLGMTSKRTVKVWIELMGTVKDIGGICSILVHPDYELGGPDGLSAYEELLNAIVIGDAWMTTPKEMITSVA